MTLIEDPSTEIRARGLKILLTFLYKFNNKPLIETGLGDVFTQAVKSTLSYLPELTPVEESIQLLEPAYSILVLLARKLFSGSEAEAKAAVEKGEYLDAVLRDGIFRSYDHAKEHVRIVEVLVRASAKIVEEMGIYAVKHLQVSWNKEKEQIRKYFQHQISHQNIIKLRYVETYFGTYL